MSTMEPENFDLPAYLKDFGRLDTAEPKTIRKRATIRPGMPPKGQTAFDERARIIYPEALLTDIYPTAIPREALPIIVGPSFKWRRPGGNHRVAAVIRESALDFIVNSEDADSGSWSAIHAAYLVNEIDPAAQISLRRGRPVEPWAATLNPVPAVRTPSRPARFFRGADIHGRRPELQEQPSYHDDGFDFSDMEFSGISRSAPIRVVTAGEWLAEQLPLDRAHWSFITNFRILGVGLFARLCTPAHNTREILDAVSPEIAKRIQRDLQGGAANSELAHPAVLQRFVELIESTQAQRVVLFDQFVSARNPADFRPTLGDSFICGNSFGTDLDAVRRARFPLEMLSVLIGAGAARVDFDRRIIEPTPDGQKVAAILSNCPDIREYQSVIVDSLLGRPKEGRLEALEEWITRYFKALKLELSRLDA
jgi:hypothetical protein